MNSNQYIDVFNSSEVLKVTYKISSIDQCGNSLYVGDQSGYVYKYIWDMEQQQSRLRQDKQSERLTRNKIDEIKCIQYVDCLLVQSDGILQLLNGYLEKSGDQIVKEKVVLFCLNESPEQFGELLVITKKESLLSFKFDKTKQVFISQKLYYLPEMPIKIAWYDKSIFTAFSDKEYDLMNSEDPTKVESLFVPICKNPFIKVLGPNEFLLLTSNNIGIPVLVDGKQAPRSPFTFNSYKPLLSLSISNSYLIALFENLIQVFTISEQPKILQEFPIQNTTLKALTQTPDKLYYASQSSIYYLQATPFEVQIQQCLKNIRIQDAFTIFEQNSRMLDPIEKQKKFEILKLDASWELFKRCQLKETEYHLFETQFDPREFIILFPEYMPNNSRKQLLLEGANPNFQTMKIVFSDILSAEVQLKKLKIDIQNETKQQLQQAKEFLIKLLNNRRQQFIGTKEKLSFITSQNNPNSQIKFSQGVTTEELLELIDYTLIRLYIEFRKDDSAKALLSGQVYCKEQFMELEGHVLVLKDTNSNTVVAKFYEQFNRVKEALDIWQTIGKTTTDQIRADEACEETIRILKDQRDKKIIMQYLKWVVTRNHNIAIKLFLHVPDNILDPHYMLNYFSEFDNTNLGSILREKYLEILVLQKKVTDEGLHTKLALFYIEMLFKLKPKTVNEATLNKNDPNYKLITNYQKKLNDYLINPSANYNGEMTLEKIKDSWLFTEEIFLYGKTKKHEQALTKMIKKSEYQMAELYCAEKTDNLLTQLFKMYIEIYRGVLDSIQKFPEDNKRKELKEFFYEMLNDFLKKYATNSQFDSIEALEIIPEDWLVSENSEDSSTLYYFLFAVISTTLHKKRNINTAKHISEMNLLQAECNLVKSKKAYVRITQDRNCAKCHRKIGDKVFAVYPDGTTIHSTCATNNASLTSAYPANKPKYTFNNKY